MSKRMLWIGLAVVVIGITAAAYVFFQGASDVCDVRLPDGSNQVLIGIRGESGRVDIQSTDQNMSVSPGAVTIRFGSYLITYENGHEYVATGTAQIRDGALTAYNLTITSDQFPTPQTCRR